MSKGIDNGSLSFKREVAVGELLPPVAEGPFEPTWESLDKGYRCPDWFHDTKFGIWAHWGPQAVGQAGDWYAKFMYCADNDWYGHRAYEKHLQMFGHPSTHGYKDILPLWKAEKWDPQRLMALYKKAGAKYFVAMGCHHDNFDCWNSQYQPWNSVRIGPHKDIVRIWKRAAEEAGLRFGVSFHADYAWWWFQPAFWSDPDGPMKGVPYDAAQNLDGKGTWWEGLNLKDLYGIDLSSEYIPGVDSRKDFFHAVPEELNNKEYVRWYCRKWYYRVKDLIDSYQPDLLYFDGAENDFYPFSGVGTGRGIKSDATPHIIAYFYNANIKKNGGRLEAVMNLKTRKGNAIVLDHESHFPEEIQQEPWQADYTIGEWFYEPGFFYDTGSVVHLLLEVISRNGNLLLNVPLNAAGELDSGGERVLEEMGEWMAVNGEGIYGTRAWKVFGEGSIRMPKGNLKEHHAIQFTSEDFRFTVKGDTLYAFCMTVPDGPVKITSLAKGSELCPRSVRSISVLGSYEKPVWLQEYNGLIIYPLKKWPCHYAVAFKIQF